MPENAKERKAAKLEARSIKMDVIRGADAVIRPDLLRKVISQKKPKAS